MPRTPRRSSSSCSSKFNPIDPIGSVDFITTELSTFVPAFQQLNREIAYLKHLDRRRKRSDAYTQVETGFLEKLAGGMYDYSVYLLQVVWGYISPILSMLIFGIFRTLVILAVYALMFYVLYFLLLK